MSDDDFKKPGITESTENTESHDNRCFSNSSLDDHTVVDASDPVFEEQSQYGPDTILDDQEVDSFLSEAEKLQLQGHFSHESRKPTTTHPEITDSILPSEYDSLMHDDDSDDETLNTRDPVTVLTKTSDPEETRVDALVSSDFADPDLETQIESGDLHVENLQDMVVENSIESEIGTQDVVSLEQIRITDSFLESVEGLDQFGPYVLLKHMGLGGMSEVRLAFKLVEQRFDHVCVVKRMFGDSLSDHEMQTMFADEVFVGRMLNHPNIVRQLDSGTINSVPYISMELIDGVSLSTFCKWHITRHLNLNIVLEISQALSRALHWIHALTDERGQPLKLIHRDITPQNILIDRDGSVKLTDFGIARFDGRFSNTKVGVTKGKLAYSSPEHLHNKRTDHRSDIFSLGVLMVELCTGQLLFPEGVLALENAESHVRHVLGEAPERIPAGLTELLVRMTALDPDQRPASAQEVELLAQTILETLVIDGTLAEISEQIISARYPPITEVVDEFLRWSMDWPTENVMRTYQESDEFSASEVTPQHVLSLFQSPSEKFEAMMNFFPKTSDFAVLGAEYFDKSDPFLRAAPPSPFSMSVEVPPPIPSSAPGSEPLISAFLSDTYLRAPKARFITKPASAKETEVPPWFVFASVLFTFAVGLAVYVSIRYLLLQ